MNNLISYLCIPFLLPILFLNLLFIRLGLIKKADKKNWEILITPVGHYRCVKLPDLDNDIIPNLFVSILDFLLKEHEIIAVSQYIDKTQGMLPDKETSLETISEKYQLDIKINHEPFLITNIASHLNEEDEFILNILGKPRQEWLDQLLFFGGTSISNIIYAGQADDQNWLEHLSAWNEHFTKWYWLKSRETDLLEVKQNIPLLCWTSDSELSVLQEESKLWLLISRLNELAEEYGLTLDIEKRDTN